MVPFIATVTVCKEGGNVAELRRGEEEHDPVKEGARLVQFLTMAWEVGGSLAQHSGVRWTVARSAGARKEKGERGCVCLVGQLSYWVGSGRWARWPMS
jgi:hypothetical protein